MKRVLLLLFLLTSACYVSAQEDPLDYYVVLKDSPAIACKIPYRIQGKIIKAVKADSSEAYIGWDRIDTIYLVRIDGSRVDERSLSRAKLKDMKQGEQSTIAQKRWVPCLIIRTNGDTLYGKADPKHDYSSEGSFDEWSKEYWGNGSFRILNDAGVSTKFWAPQLKELHILDTATTVKYIIVGDTIYKVLADGNCKLLFREKLPNGFTDLIRGRATPGSGSLQDGSFVWGPTGGHIMGTANRYYYIYKAGELYEMETETGIAAVTRLFIEDCEEMFSDCPAIIEKLKSKKGSVMGLKDIVRDYNECNRQ